MLTNNTALSRFPHTIVAAFMTAAPSSRASRCAGCVLRRADPTRESFRTAAQGRRASMLRRGGSSSPSPGDFQAQLMTEQQPMKMAAAEALCETEQPASLLDLRDRHARRHRGASFSIRIPDLLSFLATGTFDGEVEGINDLQAQAEAQLRARATTRPIIADHLLDVPLMIGLGALAALRRRRGSCGRCARAALAGRGAVRGGHRRCRSCRSSPTRSAGSSPRWAASRGSCSA